MGRRPSGKRTDRVEYEVAGGTQQHRIGDRHGHLVGPLVAAYLLGCVSQTGRGPESLSHSPEDPILTRVGEGTDPCVDFARYACASGPPGRLQREAAALRNRGPTLRRFLEELGERQHADLSKSTAVVRDVYNRCKDPGARELGLQEIRRELDLISRIGSVPDLARLLGRLRASGLPVLIHLEAYWEPMQSNGPVARVRLATPAHLTKHRAFIEFRAHLLRLAALTGNVGPDDVHAALRINDWLARAAPEENESKIPTSPLASRADLLRRRFPWQPYLTAAGLSVAAPIRPADPEVMRNIDHLAAQPLADLKSYARVQMLEASAMFLTQAFLEEERRFHRELLGGEFHREPVALAASCADLAVDLLQPWVAKAFLTDLHSSAPEDAARRMFASVRSHLVQRIDGAAWIDSQSRQASVAKVRQARLLFISDIESKRLDRLVLAPGSFRAALLQIATHVNAERFAEIGQPSSPPELYPTFEGAFYSHVVNALWISPEIVRPPYLDTGEFAAVSFGAFGTVIGHELAHSVSSDGIGWDAAGLQRETWSTTARDAFNTRLRCIERQLDSAGNGSKNNFDAHQVLDEHVADLVGVQIALSAMESDTAKSDDPQVQRARRRDFFIAYAQQQCGWSGDLDTFHGKHPPARTRIDVVLSSIPEFASTFHCPPGTTMAPVDRCSLW